MLELLWVEHPIEAQSKQTAPTKLWDRWSGRLGGLTSPFGIVLRPAQPEVVAPPFAAWEYQPDYFPAGMSLHISDAGMDKPMWVCMPFSKQRHRIEIPKHPNGGPRDHRATIDHSHADGSLARCRGLVYS